MDDLVKCLYDFVCAKRMGSVYEDPEYEEMVRSVELQTELVRKGMDENQRRELRLLLEHVSAQKDIEREHLFQASLGLARELNGLVRA